MQIKDETKRKKIIEIATRLFQEKDFHSVRLEEIAESVGISKSSIYTYYRSKNDLFFSCLNSGIRELLKETEEIVNGYDFSESFKRIVLLTLKMSDVKGPLLAVLFKNGPSSIKMSQEEFETHDKAKHKAMGLLEKLFEKGIEEGILTSKYSVKRMAIVFQGMFPLNVHMVLYNEEPLDYEQIYSMFMSVFKK